MDQHFLFFSHEIAILFQSLRKISGIGIKALCKVSHVSSRTYSKIMKHETVKYECYYRLLIGFSRVATCEEFIEQWKVLVENFYKAYSEE